VHHEKQAEAVVNGTKAFKDLPILGLPGSQLLKKATQNGLRPVQEAFADRGYTPQGTLVPRSEPNALLTNTAQIIERATRLLEGELVAVDGTIIKTQAESLCVHGDTPGAVEHARAVKDALKTVKAFV
jgi:5-oxoprolinase (ATP-hydrolysing) subunit A